MIPATCLITAWTVAMLPSLSGSPPLAGSAAPRWLRQDLDSLLARAEALKLLRKERPLRFRANVHTRIHRGAEVVVGRGELLVGGAGKIRLAMTYPAEKDVLKVLLIADGESIWTRVLRRQPGAAEVHGLSYTREPMKASEGASPEGRSALVRLFDADPGDLLRAAREKFESLSAERVGEEYILRGTIPPPEKEPKSGMPTPSRVELRFTGRELILVSQVVYDARGKEISSTRLSSVSTRIGAIKPEAFTMKIAEGFEVQDLGAKKEEDKR